MESDTVTVTRAEYEDLIDTRDAAIAMGLVGRGEMETLSEADMDAYLAASSPLQFWRKHRGLTQTKLAEVAGMTQSHLAQAERGRRGLSVGIYSRLATALRVRIEDLLPIDDG
jgi:DNA-binding XRE family transcriptional regulator